MYNNNVITLLFYLGSSLMFLGALRVHAKLSYSARRSQLIAISTGVTALLFITRALIDMASARTSIVILLLLSGLNFAGCAVTLALAAHKKRISSETSLPQH